MAPVDPPVALCVYPDRGHAEQLAALLRGYEIAVAVVPSDRHAGEWDVLVPVRDAGRATRLVQNLLAPDALTARAIPTGRWGFLPARFCVTFRPASA